MCVISWGSTESSTRSAEPWIVIRQPKTSPLSKTKVVFLARCPGAAQPEPSSCTVGPSWASPAQATPWPGRGEGARQPRKYGRPFVDRRSRQQNWRWVTRADRDHQQRRHKAGRIRRASMLLDVSWVRCCDGSAHPEPIVPPYRRHDRDVLYGKSSFDATPQKRFFSSRFSHKTMQKMAPGRMIEP